MAAPLVVSNREEDSMNNEPSMSSRNVVGLIIPPPEIRSLFFLKFLKFGPFLLDVVDKIAEFVARHGIEFENRIKERETNNPRFTFLVPTDPYHAFYRSKVTDFETGEPTEVAQPRVQLPEAVREHVQQAEYVPTHPPPAFEYTADPSTINAFDL